MAGFGDLFGEGSIGQQFLVWQVLGQIVGAAIQPGVTEVGKLVNSAVPTTPLSPADAAGMTARGLIDNGTGEDIANDSGIGGQDFSKLVMAALSSPDMGAVIAAYQRSIITAGSGDPTEASLHGAYADNGIRPDWWPVLDKLTVQIPSVAEVMNAWLEGQIEEPEANTRYLAAGGDPTWFQTSYNANGQAPTPTQALELLNRGIIKQYGTGPGETSYQQAFLEGPWRNKWLTPFLALANYLPPPRTVTAMYHSGQLTHDQAAVYLADQGLDSDLVTAYLSKSSTATTATEKVLAKADVVSLYKDKLITHDDAISHLVALKYTASDAALILEIADLSAIKSALTAGVARVRTLYLAHKITETDAAASLVQLGVTTAQAAEIIDTWALTSVQTTKTLTAAEILGGWYYEVISTADVITQLMALGYDETDAWILLTVKNKDPIPGSPLPVVKNTS